MAGLVLVQEAADPLDLLQQAMVVLIHQTHDPAARRAFRALLEDGKNKPDTLDIAGLNFCALWGNRT